MKPIRAFTLVEVLVGIAILAGLCALAAPVFGRMRGSVDASRCMTNLRRLGEIVHLAASDADGRVPRIRNAFEIKGIPTAHADAPTLTEFVVRNGGSREMLVCPAGERNLHHWLPSYEWLPLYEGCLLAAPAIQLPVFGSIPIPFSEAMIASEFASDGAWPHRIQGAPGGFALMADGSVKPSGENGAFRGAASSGP